MDTGGVRHPGRAVRQGGPEDQHREEIRDGLPPVPGVGNAVGDSVRATDDGSRAFLLGWAECSGSVRGVRGGYGAQVSVSPSTDAVW